MTSGFVEVTEEQMKLHQQSDWETSQSHPLQVTSWLQDLCQQEKGRTFPTVLFITSQGWLDFTLFSLVFTFLKRSLNKSKVKIKSGREKRVLIESQQLCVSFYTSHIEGGADNWLLTAGLWKAEEMDRYSPATQVITSAIHRQPKPHLSAWPSPPQLHSALPHSNASGDREVQPFPYLFQTKPAPQRPKTKN